jgi:hypothetical protein
MTDEYEMTVRRRAGQPGGLHADLTSPAGAPDGAGRPLPSLVREVAAGADQRDGAVTECTLAGSRRPAPRGWSGPWMLPPEGMSPAATQGTFARTGRLWFCHPPLLISARLGGRTALASLGAYPPVPLDIS